MSRRAGLSLLPSLLLVGVTAVWGWTFVIVKAAIAQYPVVAFLGVRFALAAIVLWTIVTASRVGRRSAIPGLGIGVVLALGYLLQTLGLQRTTVANTGLLTGLFVVFTPILDRLIFQVPTRAGTWAGILVAFAGTGLLTGAAPGGLHPGDVLVVLGSIAFALHITLLSRFAGLGPLRLAAWQMTAAAILLLTGSLTVQTSVFPIPLAVWPALLITGIFASALAFWIQTWVQQRIPASRAALILTTEPAFTVLFAFWLAGERFTVLQALGAILILGAILYNETRERR